MSIKFSRRDANHAEIVNELRERGFEVDDVSSVRGLGYDIVVTGNNSRGKILTVRVEIKTQKGKLTDAEKKKFASAFTETLIVARDYKDVVEWYLK